MAENCEQLTENGDSFYVDAKKYWTGIPATVDGMLGGFSHLSSTDIGSSNKFLRYFFKNHNVGTSRALDCGAGIGRITKMLLTKMFDAVDMVELNEDFLKQAKSYLGEQADKVERLMCCGLQDFTPEDGRYDVIWCQWVLGHLTDDDLIAFFQRCRKGLAPNGIIAIKENVASGKEAEFDSDDSSYTRPKNDLVKLIHKSGLKILKEEKQKNFPKDIYAVYTFALQ